jgi:hypothetical protein
VSCLHSVVPEGGDSIRPEDASIRKIPSPGDRVEGRSEVTPPVGTTTGNKLPRGKKLRDIGRRSNHADQPPSGCRKNLSPHRITNFLMYSAISSGSSITLKMFRSSLLIIPWSTIWVFMKAIRSFQYELPIRITGKGRIFRV